MSDLLRLSVRDLTVPAEAETFSALVHRAVSLDGSPPFSDQALVDARSGSRTLIAAVRVGDLDGSADTVVGYAITGQGELELVIDPEWRGAGWGGAALEGVLGNTPGGLLAWAHGDHPAAAALARTHDFRPVRRLLRLRLPAAGLAAIEEATPPAGIALTALHPGPDDAALLALNAASFASHPEQGSWESADLRARYGEAWFDPGLVVVARDATDDLAGFTWIKREPGAAEAEIYVMAVSPRAQGRGLGRVLLREGLDRARRSGVSEIVLYVEGDNAPALSLYRAHGFLDDQIDVQYRQQTPLAAPPSR